MKSLKYITIAGLTLLTLSLNSCSPEFLDRKPTTAVSNEEALTSVTNVQSATVGLMRYFATSGYTGRNLPVIGDLIADNVTTIKGNSGHLLDIERWNISSSLGEVSTFWGGSYQIASAAAKVVEACENLREGASSSEKTTLDKCKASALTVKVFAEYILTQYYCLPYSAAGSSVFDGIGATPADMNGIILIPKNHPIQADNAIDANSTLRNASLDSTYKHMHEELADAIKLFGESSKDFSTTSNAAYFPSLCMAYTLQARLYLEQGYYIDANSTTNFENAYEAANNALNNLPNSAKKELVGDGQKFLEQFRSISAPTQEDILTVNFTASDNLSSNSINNMFGSYGASVSKDVTDLFYNKNKDIRSVLYRDKPETKDLEIYSYCGKYPNQDQINNVPVLRVPELYLIQAEARANMTNSVDDPQYRDAMLATLGVRDTSIQGDYEKLKEAYFKNPSNPNNEALSYVLDERRREFAGEGHRWFDMRRTKTPLTHKNKTDFRIEFTNYPIYVFAFPIPESETNTGAWKNGKLKQNEFWNVKNGDSWSPKIPLPVDGGVYT
ncbi:MAG: RagB/SusD family nutrient uptake outer membrane protein, partial [Bacteroidales bacterium]|nr:RagB/SusD family nutrient uptake outer membrane protein [Bacteroidales bacterium]